MISARDLRNHAEEFRVLAAQMIDPDIRLRMLGLASDLDRYAARKEAADRAKQGS